MPIRVVLADDHPIVLKGVEELLKESPEFEVVARCTDAEETLQAVRDYQPDVLVLDIRMPGADGLSVVRTIRREHIGTRIILLTVEMDDEHTMAAIRLGVEGIVLKDMASELLLRCLHKVHAGGRWVEIESLRSVVEKLLAVDDDEHPDETLTEGELKVVRLAIEGLRIREIAADLGIAEGTVKTHLHNIYTKLGVNSRAQMIEYARRWGLAGAVS
jgi:DNA-binding NarL/FixJ family response regulator